MARILWFSALLGVLALAVLGGLVPLTPAVAGIVVVAFLCELMDSSLGMGYGTTLTPILLFAGWEPLQLVPTILVSEFLSGFAASFFHHEAGNVRFARGSMHGRVALILSVCSFIGVFAGVQLAFEVSAADLRRIIGTVILAAGLFILVFSRRVFVYRTWKVALLAITASFNKAISGGGYGPLMTSGQVLSGIEGRAAVGITSLAEGFTCLAGALLFLLHGQALEPALLVPVACGALLSVPVSARLVRRFPEAAMKRVIGVLTVVMGALVLLKSLG